MVIREEEVMVVDHTVVVQEVINGRSCQKSVILVHNNQATTNSQNQVDSITSGESRNIAPLDVIIVGGGLSGLIVA